jgi:hypothetical protein
MKTTLIQNGKHFTLLVNDRIEISRDNGRLVVRREGQIIQEAPEFGALTSPQARLRIQNFAQDFRAQISKVDEDASRTIYRVTGFDRESIQVPVASAAE